MHKEVASNHQMIICTRLFPMFRNSAAFADMLDSPSILHCAKCDAVYLVDADDPTRKVDILEFGRRLEEIRTVLEVDHCMGHRASRIYHDGAFAYTDK